jgi:hypothetical protein
MQTETFMRKVVSGLLILGTGKRLFPEGIDIKALRLVETKPFDSCMVRLSYQPDDQ